MANPIKIDRFASSAGCADTDSRPRFTLPLYTVAELAKMWKLSDDAVRKLFESESGILAIGEERSGRKRRYVTLRIPEDVVERVYRRLTRA